jgi:glycosyltransferase involved in cell wall biosynthesis
VKVSVVIPVHNTGDDLSRCAESVLAQTMDDYEVIFVDDGSSDGTEKRLDELAAEDGRLRVIHLPPSGGPGGPRNAGIDAARGDYVYFLDDDDWLGEEALERMYAMALRNDSDIVIGKMVGHGRRVPRLMFKMNRDRADILKDALLGILTPHKLFRRSFLVSRRRPRPVVPSHVYGDGTPLVFANERWEPPVPVGVPREALQIDDRPWRLDLYIRRRTDNADFPVPITAELLGDGAMSGEAVLDAEALPRLPDGTWDLVGRVDGGGWTYERRLSGYPEDVPARGILEPYRTVNGNLSIRVRSAPKCSFRRVVRWFPGTRLAARRLRG